MINCLCNLKYFLAPKKTFFDFAQRNQVTAPTGEGRLEKIIQWRKNLFSIKKND
jgi:hypothetical protein